MRFVLGAGVWVTAAVGGLPPTWKIWTIAVAKDPGSAGTTMLRLRVFTLTPARVGFSSLVLITRHEFWENGCCSLLLGSAVGQSDGANERSVETAGNLMRSSLVASQLT